MVKYLISFLMAFLMASVSLAAELPMRWANASAKRVSVDYGKIRFQYPVVPKVVYYGSTNPIPTNYFVKYVSTWTYDTNLNTITLNDSLNETNITRTGGTLLYDGTFDISDLPSLYYVSMYSVVTNTLITNCPSLRWLTVDNRFTQGNTNTQYSLGGVPEMREIAIDKYPLTDFQSSQWPSLERMVLQTMPAYTSSVMDVSSLSNLYYFYTLGNTNITRLLNNTSSNKYGTFFMGTSFGGVTNDLVFKDSPDLVGLYIQSGSFTNISITNCPKATPQISGCGSLVGVNMNGGNNPAATLYVGTCSNLTYVDVSNCSLKDLLLPTNKKLGSILIGSNSTLQTIAMNYGNAVSNMDLSGCTALSSVNFDGTYDQSYTNLLVTNLLFNSSNLKGVSLNYNRTIQDIRNLSPNTNTYSGGSIRIYGNTAITNVQFGNMGVTMTSILEGNQGVPVQYCDYMLWTNTTQFQLSNISDTNAVVISGFPKCGDFRLYSSGARSITFTNCTVMSQIAFSSTNTTDIDLSGLGYSGDISVYFAGCTSVTNLVLGSLKFSSINIDSLPIPSFSLPTTQPDLAYFTCGNTTNGQYSIDLFRDGYHGSIVLINNGKNAITNFIAPPDIGSLTAYTEAHFPTLDLSGGNDLNNIEMYNCEELANVTLGDCWNVYNIMLYEAGLTQASVDDIITKMYNTGNWDNAFYVDVSGAYNAVPSESVMALADEMNAYGCTVGYNTPP